MSVEQVVITTTEVVIGIDSYFAHRDTWYVSNWYHSSSEGSWKVRDTVMFVLFLLVQCLIAYDKVTIWSKAEVNLLVHTYVPSTMPCPKVTVLYRNMSILMKNHSCLFFSVHFFWCFMLLKIIYLLEELLKCVSVFTSICSPCCPYMYLFKWWKSCSSPLGETQVFIRQWQNDITSKGMHWIHWIFCCFFFFFPSQEAVDVLSIQKRTMLPS